MTNALRREAALERLVASGRIQVAQEEMIAAMVASGQVSEFERARVVLVGWKSNYPFPSSQSVTGLAPTSLGSAERRRELL